MSSDSDLVMAEQVLQGLLQNDNNIRNQAEAKLRELMNTKEPLCIVLSRLLNRSTNEQVLTYSAIILRKLFIVKDDEISSEVWVKFSEASKNEIKQNLYTAIANCQLPRLQKKYVDAAANIYACLSENEEKWEDLLRLIVQGLNLQLNEQNLPKIEFSLYLLAAVYCTAYDDLKAGIPTYQQCFKIYFSSNNLSLRAKTVKCINELLCSAMSKKETKQFKDFMFSILETTKNCLEAHDNLNLRICLESLNDLSNCEPKILRKNFPDIFILMGMISQNKDIDEELRKISLEILIALINGTPKVIEKNEEKLTLLIQGLFKYAMEIDNTIDDDWLTPNTETYMEDEFIPEEKLDEACNLLTRLFDALPDSTEQLLKIVSDNITQLLAHSGEDWKYKYISYIVIAEIISYIDDLGKIQDIIKAIIQDTKSPNVKVQYASLYCIAEIGEEHNPDFQNEYHQIIMPLLLEILKSSSVLRIRIEACDAMECFVEHLIDQSAALYMKDSLELLFQVFLQPTPQSPSSLKQIILSVINEFMDASAEQFKQFAPKCLEILLQVLQTQMTTTPDKNLLGLLLESISTIIPLCPDLFKSQLIPMVNVLNSIQKELKSFKDNMANYIYSTWEKLVPLLNDGHKDQFPAIIESLLILLSNPPEMSVASNPNEKIDLQSFFSDDDKGEKKKDKATLETSETEEYSTFLEILNLFLENSPEVAVQYKERLYPMVQKLIHYPNEDIQGESAEVLPWIIEGLSKGDINLLHKCSKEFISDLIGQMEKEKSFNVIVDLMTAVKDIIDKTKVFLSTPEINILSEKILAVFNNVEKARIALMDQKEKTEKEIENDKKTGANKIYSDDEDDGSEEEIIDDIKDQIEELEEVQTSFSDFFGSLFRTHKQLTLELVEKLFREYLEKKYLLDTASSFEKKIGILILDDCAEFLEQNLLPHYWVNIKNILIKFADHSDYTLRNAAVYGLGVFSQHTFTDFKPMANDILLALKKSLEFPPDAKKKDKENVKFSKDNSVSALGKIIKYHGGEVDELKNLVQFWLDNMPIVSDNEEGVIMNKFLMEIIEKDPILVIGEGYKNLGHIVAVLVKGLDTEFCDSETNTKIKEFIKRVKENNDMKNVCQIEFDKMKEGKNKNKIKRIFNE